jgi:hypothetical protein
VSAVAKKGKSSTRCHSNQHASLRTCRNNNEIYGCCNGGDEVFFLRSYEAVWPRRQVLTKVYGVIPQKKATLQQRHVWRILPLRVWKL